MYINETYKDLPLLSDASSRFIRRDGSIQEETDELLIEHQIDVYVNDILTMKLICIPQHLTELVLGRLLTEGIIQSTDDVEQIYICEFGSRARVILKDTAAGLKKDSSSLIEYVEETPTCCTGNHVLNDLFMTHKDLRPLTPIPWKTDWVFALADRFADGMPLHSHTFATHSAFLAVEDQLLFSCEDIGRHNALDKIIGYALRHNIELSRCMVYSSGRIPTDMAEKAIRAGIPILASKASPSAEAITLAEHYQLTLICAARRDRMKLFAGPMPVDYHE